MLTVNAYELTNGSGCSNFIKSVQLSVNLGIGVMEYYLLVHKKANSLNERERERELLPSL